MSETTPTTIRKGMTKSYTDTFGEDYTVADLLSNREILALLGAGENVRAVSNGETLEPTDLVYMYEVITLEEAAAKKA